MLKLRRVCIPLGFNCNFKCVYCYRELSQHAPALELSDLMKTYLMSLSPEWCEAVVMSGGEPLMYFDKVKEVLSYVPKNVHKKVMSNGSLLTQEIVDYVNENGIEFTLSHDGECTADLRGKDVLMGSNIKSLVQQINILTIFGVCTNKNPDVIKNYKDSISKLGRSNIFYVAYPVYDNGLCKDLIEGFDYDTFERSWREFNSMYRIFPVYDTGDFKRKLWNVDLQGNVHDKNTMVKFGTVADSLEYCTENYEKFYKDKYCSLHDCSVREICGGIKANASEHYCRCIRIMEALD